MHETDLRGRSCHGLKSETDQRAEVPAEPRKWDAEGREIAWVERAFVAASSDGDDAAEEASALEEGEEVGNESQTGVII